MLLYQIPGLIGAAIRQVFRRAQSGLDRVSTPVLQVSSGSFAVHVLLLVIIAIGLPWQGIAADTPMEMTMDHNEGHTASMMSMQQTVDPKQWVEEKTGGYIPLDTTFKDEKGDSVSLRDIIDRPTLLLPVYYYCPRACSFDLANLAEAIRQTKHPYGSFKVIAMSFNHMEPPEAAAISKPNYTELLGDKFNSNDWPFLTGTQEDIVSVTRSIGYRFKKQNDQLFIHPSAMVALDSEGRIIKYIYGSFLSGDVDLAIAEAAKGTPAVSIKRFLAFCYNYSPTKNQTVFNILKLGSVILLAGGLFYLIFFVLRRKT